MKRSVYFFFQAKDGIRGIGVTGVQTCALPISAGVTALRPGSTTANASSRSPTTAAAKPSRSTTRSLPPPPASADRKSVVVGKSVDLGGRRILKKKNIIFPFLSASFYDPTTSSD